jgi:hypothetical protein
VHKIDWPKFVASQQTAGFGEVPQVQQTGILSEKIFGIPSVYFLGGVALAFLLMRKTQRSTE